VGRAIAPQQHLATNNGRQQARVPIAPQPPVVTNNGRQQAGGSSASQPPVATNNGRQQAGGPIAAQPPVVTNNVRELARIANANAAQQARGGNPAGVGAVLAAAPGGPPRGRKRKTKMNFTDLSFIFFP